MHDTTEVAPMVDKRVLGCPTEALRSAIGFTETTYGLFLGPNSNAFAWGRLFGFVGDSELLPFGNSLGIGMEMK